MHTLTCPTANGALVEADALTCPGCHETAIPQRPTVSGLGAAGAEFSHRDGSELCTDGRGLACDPMEVRR